jgi:amino acid permease
VKGDILLNYPQSSLVTAMRIGIAIMVIFSYPLQLNPSRHCLKSLIYVWVSKRESVRRRRNVSHGANHLARSPHGIGDGLADHLLERLDDQSSSSMVGVETNQYPNLNQNQNQNQSVATVGVDQEMIQLMDDFLFYAITCIFLVLSYLIAMSVSDLGIILGVVGATGSTMVSYILPGKLYIPRSLLLSPSLSVSLSIIINVCMNVLMFYTNIVQVPYTCNCIQNHILCDISHA